MLFKFLTQPVIQIEINLDNLIHIAGLERKTGPRTTTNAALNHH